MSTRAHRQKPAVEENCEVRCCQFAFAIRGRVFSKGANIDTKNNLKLLFHAKMTTKVIV